MSDAIKVSKEDVDIAHANLDRLLEGGYFVAMIAGRKDGQSHYTQQIIDSPRKVIEYSGVNLFIAFMRLFKRTGHLPKKHMAKTFDSLVEAMICSMHELKDEIYGLMESGMFWEITEEAIVHKVIEKYFLTEEVDD